MITWWTLCATLRQSFPGMIMGQNNDSALFGPIIDLNSGSRIYLVTISCIVASVYSTLKTKPKKKSRKALVWIQLLINLMKNKKQKVFL